MSRKRDQQLFLRNSRGCLAVVCTPAQMNRWSADHEKPGLTIADVFPKVSKIALEMKAVPTLQEVRLISDRELHFAFDAQLQLLP